MKSEKRTNIISYLCYRFILWLIKVFYPKITVEGFDNLPREGCIVVGNHAQMNGPICGEIYFPGKHSIWCASQMMNLKEVPAYAYQDFWSGKPKYIRWIYRLLSYIIAPLSVCLFNNASTIPVYRDSRLISTFKQTIADLQENSSVIIFPEHYEPHNHIVNDFQDKFVDIAKFYYKRTGKAISFVPMYVAPKLKKLFLGKPIIFNPETPIEEERRRICYYLMNEITDIAVAQPMHTVVNYANISKKSYHTNIVTEGEYKMRKPIVDYRKLRLSNITSPEYRHLLLLLGWPVYFSFYFLTENLISPENCYPVHCWLDDVVPFCEWFIIPYVGWYLLIVVSLLYFALYNVKNFKNLQKFIIITQTVAVTIYILFPNRQDLRPVDFPRHNVLTDIIGWIYSVDTNTGVCPSLHVAYSLGIASTWLKEKSASKMIKTLVVVAVISICMSVAFVKQHSVVDIFAAIPLGLFAELLVFGKSYYRKNKQTI
ncbi:MAG: hypothetical protein QM644_03550 [Mobilitalea sp.]